MKTASSSLVEGFFAANSLESNLLKSENITEAADLENFSDWSEYYGSFAMGYDDGYHDSFLEGYIDRLVSDYDAAMLEMGVDQKFQYETNLWNPDGASTQTYLSGYNSGASAGYTAGFNRQDYTEFYAGENLDYKPSEHLSLNTAGQGSGYLDGYLDGMAKYLFGNDVNYMYSADGPSEWNAGYDQQYNAGVTAGSVMAEYTASHASFAQLSEYAYLF